MDGWVTGPVKSLQLLTIVTIQWCSISITISVAARNWGHFVITDHIPLSALPRWNSWCHKKLSAALHEMKARFGVDARMRTVEGIAAHTSRQAHGRVCETSSAHMAQWSQVTWLSWVTYRGTAQQNTTAKLMQYQAPGVASLRNRHWSIPTNCAKNQLILNAKIILMLTTNPGSYWNMAKSHWTASHNKVIRQLKNQMNVDKTYSPLLHR